MAGMKLDRDLQRAILLRLREAYPEIVDLSTLDIAKREWFHPNAFYLAALSLIEPTAARRDVTGAPSQILTARITARGLDFLEDDGGISAILGAVTVKIEPATLRALLETRIDDSDLPAAEKAKLKSKLGTFAGKAAEKVLWRLFDELLKHPDTIIGVLKGLGQ